MVSQKIIRRPYLSLAATCTLMSVATTTHAGFQWVPSQEAAPQMQSKPMSAPTPPVIMQKIEQEPLPLEPLPILQTNDMHTPPPIGSEPKMKTIEMHDDHPMQSTEKVVMPEDAPAAAMESMESHEKMTPHKTMKPMAMSESVNATEVLGFGSDMPLALALRQVVPVEYAFSFGNEVNPGYRVSWNGGKPWDQVVAEMIAPLDLVPVIQDKVVHIKKIGVTNTMSMTPIGQDTNAPSIVLSRKNIVDPGQTQQVQRPETINHIQKLAKAKPTLITASESSALIEPSTGDAKETQFWEAQKGDSLKDTLARWSAQTGTALVWEAQKDYTINDHVFVNDTYTNAIKMVFDHLLAEEAAPTLRLRSGDNGQNQLIIGDMG